MVFCQKPHKKNSKGKVHIMIVEWLTVSMFSGLCKTNLGLDYFSQNKAFITSAFSLSSFYLSSNFSIPLFLIWENYFRMFYHKLWKGLNSILFFCRCNKCPLFTFHHFSNSILNFGYCNNFLIPSFSPMYLGILYEIFHPPIIFLV